MYKRQVEECGIDYQVNVLNWNSTSNITNVALRTTYSFEACMDQCSLFNSQQVSPSQAANGGVDNCQAVTYNANLTFALADNGGNCWLKSSRGQKYTYGAAYDALLGSAFILNDL